MRQVEHEESANKPAQKSRSFRSFLEWLSALSSFGQFLIAALVFLGVGSLGLLSFHSKSTEWVDRLEHDPLWNNRLDAAQILADCRDKCRDAIPALRHSMANSSEEQHVRIAAARALIAIDPRGAGPPGKESDPVAFLDEVLTRAELNGGPILPEEAIDGLGIAGPLAKNALPALRAALCNRPGSTMAKAYAALQRVEGSEAASRDYLVCRR